tara:strand:- start:104308 stop:104610 length:303 start_codon:yes stop_codon:yes gene_type:complete
MQLAKERVELKYAKRTLESNDMLITNFKDALDLYKSNTFLLNSTLNERDEEIVRLRLMNGSLDGDLDLVSKQLRRERGKKWIVGGVVVVSAAGILYLVTQ